MHQVIAFNGSPGEWLSFERVTSNNSDSDSVSIQESKNGNDKFSTKSDSIYLSIYIYCLNPVKRTFGQVRRFLCDIVKFANPQ